MREWSEYYRNLLGGIEWRVVRGFERGLEEGE